MVLYVRKGRSQDAFPVDHATILNWPSQSPSCFQNAARRQSGLPTNYWPSKFGHRRLRIRREYRAEYTILFTSLSGPESGLLVRIVPRVGDEPRKMPNESGPFFLGVVPPDRQSIDCDSRLGIRRYTLLRGSCTFSLTCAAIQGIPWMSWCTFAEFLRLP